MASTSLIYINCISKHISIRKPPPHPSRYLQRGEALETLERVASNSGDLVIAQVTVGEEDSRSVVMVSETIDTHVIIT